jgi:hypothetical protein
VSAAGTERSKLELLERQRGELVDQREALRAEVAELPAQIKHEREEAVYAKPTRRPGSELGGAVNKLEEKLRKKTAAIATLDQDISALNAVIEREDAKRQEEETAAARRALGQLHKHEEAVWKRTGEAFSELVSCWNELVDIAEKENALAVTSGLERSVLVTPFPASFRALLIRLIDGALDPTNEYRVGPEERDIIDYGVYGRRDEKGNDLGGAVYDGRKLGTETIERRKKLDPGDVLFNVLPDLRGKVRTPTLRSVAMSQAVGD